MVRDVRDPPVEGFDPSHHFGNHPGENTFSNPGDIDRLDHVLNA